MLTMKHEAALFLRALLARAYPRVAWLVRQPSWLVQETLLPLLSISAFAFAYRAMQAPPEYVGFVILGGAMTTFWLNVLWSMGAQLYWERDAGNLELYIIAPAPLMAILGGMALGGMALSVIRASVILIGGSILFGVEYAVSSWWLLAGVFLLTLLALYGLGMVFASAFLMWGREAWHTVSLFQEPVYLLSGQNFPVKTLHWAVAGLAMLLPLTAGMDALRQLLFADPAGVGFLPVSVEAALLAGLTVLFLGLAKVCLSHLERKARAEGRLTVKWQ